jgi:hypothetical protein
MSGGNGEGGSRDPDGFQLTPWPGGRGASPGAGESSDSSPDLETVLERLYSKLADYVSTLEALARKSFKTVEQLIADGLEQAKRDGRVTDASEATARRLYEGSPSGPELLLFFGMKCPHARDAFMRGEAPPYPWRTATTVVVGQSQPPDDPQGGEDQADEPAGVAPTTSRIPDRFRRAHESYEWVCSERPDLVPGQENVRFAKAMHGYVREHDCPAYPGDDRPPAYETWKRYIREYERLTEGPKNASRAGRERGSRSIVRPDQI